MTKPGPDASALLALRCSRASLLLSSLRRPRASTAIRTSSSAAERDLRTAGLLRAELAAARREAAVHARASGAELLLVLSLVPFLLLFGLLAAAAAAAT